jgi:ribose/xylose/arabinose/galactoside ABC-type transport system permease subunit
MSATQTRRARLADKGPTYGALAALVVLVLLNVIFTANFASTRTLWNLLLQTANVIIVSVGMTFVIATGGVDLSVGATMAIASTVAVLAMPYGAGAAVAAALGVGLLVGLFNGFFVAFMNVAPFIVTLAVLITGRGVAQVISREGQLIPFDNPTFLGIGRGSVGPVPTQVILTAICFVIGWFVMRATAFGRYVVAVGGNEDAARLAGVPVRRTKLLVYAATGLLSGLAGIVDTARLGTSDPSNIGLIMELAAIASVVVGGTSLSGGRATMPGTIVGALIMAIIGTSFNMLRLPFAYGLVATGAIILFAVWLQRPRVA